MNGIAFRSTELPGHSSGSFLFLTVTSTYTFGLFLQAINSYNKYAIFPKRNSLHCDEPGRLYRYP